MSQAMASSMLGWLDRPQGLSPQRLGQIMLGVGIIILTLFLCTQPAFAALDITLFFGDGGGFQCNGRKAIGTLYSASDNCPATLTTSNVFAFMICNVEHLSSNLTGNIFCGMVDEFRPAIYAMVTLAVLIFGIGFTIGIIPATAKDFQGFILKMSIVLICATQADVIIGIGYNLLVTSMRTGILIGISGLYEDIKTPVQVYARMDKFLLNALHVATDMLGVDPKAANANTCTNAMFAVLGVMSVAFPPIFYMGILMIIRVSMTFFRAVFGYLYALLFIMLLVAMAPVFVPFYLFQATKKLFDKWLDMLINLSIQMVLVFTFLAFVLSINVSFLATGIGQLAMTVTTTTESSTFRTPWSYCTLCDFEMIDGAGNISKSINTMERLQCKKPITPILLSSATAPSDNKPINALFTFATTIFLALLVLAYVSEALLSSIPSIAQSLSIANAFTPQLVGGLNPRGGASLDMPGGAVANAMETGFDRGFARGAFGGTDAKGNPIPAGGSTGGFKEGLKGAAEHGAQEAGSSLLSFLINPQGNRRH